MGTEPRRLRALVAEDEPAARRTLRTLLEQDDEIEVVGKAAGRAALTRWSGSRAARDLRGP